MLPCRNQSTFKRLIRIKFNQYFPSFLLPHEGADSIHPPHPDKGVVPAATTADIDPFEPIAYSNDNAFQQLSRHDVQSPRRCRSLRSRTITPLKSHLVMTFRVHSNRTSTPLTRTTSRSLTATAESQVTRNKIFGKDPMIDSVGDVQAYKNISRTSHGNEHDGRRETPAFS
jgi:hypothetical protein